MVIRLDGPRGEYFNKTNKIKKDAAQAKLTRLARKLWWCKVLFPLSVFCVLAAGYFKWCGV